MQFAVQEKHGNARKNYEAGQSSLIFYIIYDWSYNVLLLKKTSISIYKIWHKNYNKTSFITHYNFENKNEIPRGRNGQYKTRKKS